MGIFSFFKNVHRRTEAVVVIQQILDVQRNAGIFNGDSSRIAQLVVKSAWVKDPDMFEGRFDQRPHKLPIAAFALATSIEALPRENPAYLNLALCLSTILKEVQSNGGLYPFNGLDWALLEKAAEVHTSVASTIDPKGSLASSLSMGA